MLLSASFLAAAPGESGPQSAANRSVTLVTLGDSITKGERPGVRSNETFSSILERDLNARGIAAEVVNMGIGGERTDQALARLGDVAARSPRYATIMYGTNDSYVDRGASESRLSPEAFGANLESLVAELLLAGIEPILMTEPRWAADAPVNGLGENPNLRLEPFMEITRSVARRSGVPLVDHFADWTAEVEKGRALADWTTDGCHPNPTGHRRMADAILPILLERLTSDIETTNYRIELETLLVHDDADFLWFHPRAAPIPGLGEGARPTIVMTIQKHLLKSDHYSGLSFMRSGDLGASWSRPDPRPELDWTRDGDVDIAVADVTPGWHAPAGKLLAVGAQVRYSRAGDQLEDQPRAHQTAYAVYDPRTDDWTKWRRLEMPDGEEFNFARSACAQFVVEPGGTVLLPFYIAPSASDPFSATVVRCAFDGDRLTYIEHGDVMRLDVSRGLYEPSLIRFGSRYYLTLRNDVKGYVTAGDDGLHYRPVKPWMFDDGRELGSYNTQQHWLAHGGALFLVYTRRGAENDHIMRHRAPLFMAQVDPDRLHVLGETERVIVPERGATLGNFGATAIDENESWVTVAEGVWGDDARERGARGAVFAARIIWGEAEKREPSGESD